MTILVIDDNSILRQILIRLFEINGFRVSEARNGQEGLDALASESIQMVISDIEMPVMDGIVFLKQAREKFPDLPIFIMSAGSAYSQQFILDSGANRYFDKSSGLKEDLIRSVKMLEGSIRATGVRRHLKTASE